MNRSVENKPRFLDQVRNKLSRVGCADRKEAHPTETHAMPVKEILISKGKFLHRINKKVYPLSLSIDTRVASTYPIKLDNDHTYPYDHIDFWSV